MRRRKRNGKRENNVEGLEDTGGKEELKRPNAKKVRRAIAVRGERESERKRESMQA